MTLQNTFSYSAFEELLVSIILSDFETDINSNSGLIFQLVDTRKEIYLLNYINDNNLENQVHKLPNSNKWEVKPSLLSKKFLRSWTDNKTHVTAIDPRLLSENAFILWVLLFGEKSKSGVDIHTSLDNSFKLEISKRFERKLGARLLDKGTLFQIKNYHYLLLNSFGQRSASEHLELNYLLPDGEAAIFKKKKERLEYV